MDPYAENMNNTSHTRNKRASLKTADVGRMAATSKLTFGVDGEIRKV